MRKELVARLVKHMLTPRVHKESYKDNQGDTMCSGAVDLDATQEEFDLAWTLAKLMS